MKKVLQIVLAAMMIVSSLSVMACGKQGEKIRTDQTQLYVAIEDGGYGSQWAEKAKERFVEKYKDVSFEEGKKGVQVIVDSSPDYKGEKLVNLLGDKKFKYEVIFTEGIEYYDLEEYAMDITDVWTKPLQYDFVTKETDTTKESATIESKIIVPELKEYMSDDGKYYAVPYFDAYYGIVYDIDVFEECLLYFAKPGEPNDGGFITSLSTPKSTGPDGQYGTYDDGLPATYEDFFKLCDRMIRWDLSPITWTGKYPEYMSYFAQALCVDYEGKDSMKCDLEFQGEIDTYVSGFDGAGNPQITTKNIDIDHSYELNNKRAGKYYALKFIEQLVDNKKYYNEIDAMGKSIDHKEAQKNFLYSKRLQGNSIKRIAMLIDGSWWLNEASGAFDTLVKTYDDGESAQNRRFGVMPLPKATADKVGEPYTISNGGSSYGFIKNTMPEWKVDLAKAFMQFLHTNESLCEFGTVTNATRPFAYDFTDEQFNKLTAYGQTTYNIHKSASFYVPYSKNVNFKRNSAKIGYMWCSKIGTLDYDYPRNTFYNNPNFTAKQYFEGISDFYNPTKWEILLTITK